MEASGLSSEVLAMPPDAPGEKSVVSLFLEN